MSDSTKIRRALISVYDKIGIVDFARALHDEFGIEIISTGGTAKALTDAGIPVTLVEDVTRFPEMMDGRVKTLHPKIHAAILADRDNPEHVHQLKKQGIEPIDMVVVNLYPFEKTIAQPDCTFEQAIEMIDIGGPCLLRAAAKNHRHVLVLSNSAQYRRTLRYLRNDEKTPGPDWPLWLMTKAFQATAPYDIAIHKHFAELYWEIPFTPMVFLRLGLSTPTPGNELRYGENPHQRASVYGVTGVRGGVVHARVFGNEDLFSFNNYADASAAMELCAELTRAQCGGPGGLKSAALYEGRGSNEEEPRASARPVSRDEGLSTPTHAAPPNEEPWASARPVPRPEQASLLASVFQEPDRNSPAWLLTWTTYGSWLPGDKRGFVSRRPTDSGGSAVRNIPGTPYDADQEDAEDAAKERMKGTPVSLTEAEAQTALEAFVEAANTHGIALIAVSIMSDHVHLLCQGEQDGTKLMQLFKGVSARRMSQAHALPDAPRWWTTSGSRRYIQKGSDPSSAVEYICEQKGALCNCWFGELSRIGTSQGRMTGQAEARGSSGTPTTEQTETRDVSHTRKTGRTEVRGSSSKSGSCAVCFIKHTNACGAAIGTDPTETYRKAYLGDPNAAMGGILAVNFNVDAEFAATVMETYQRWGKPLREAGHPAAPGAFFIEVWLAPSFDEKAVRIIRGEAEGKPQKAWGKRVRLLEVGDMSTEPDASEMDIKRIAGGVLMQGRDLVGLNEDEWKVVTERQPTEAETADLRLAWLICKHTKSNAITVCKDGMLLGNGAGQMSRVMSCRIATWLAKENGHEKMLKGAVAASDAFFPFRDGPDILADAGVTALIQPGGSKRDEDTIAACNERGIAMIFTGTRHFKH